MADPQHAALLKNIIFISQAVCQANITTLAEKLLESDLITKQICDSTIGDKRPERILAFLQDKIKKEPTKFDDFLKALRSSELETIADKLESDYREF